MSKVDDEYAKEIGVIERALSLIASLDKQRFAQLLILRVCEDGKGHEEQELSKIVEKLSHIFADMELLTLTAKGYLFPFWVKKDGLTFKLTPRGEKEADGV